MGQPGRPDMLRPQSLIIFLLLSLADFSVAQVRNVAGLAAQVSSSQAAVSDLQRRMAGLQRTTAGTDTAPVLAVDATLGSGTSKCGPQTITGWTENVDYYRKAAAQTTSQFDPRTGVFTAPILGYYKICSSVIAAYGSSLQTDWRTTGVCTIQLLSVSDTISLKIQSGGSSDCVQETSYKYSRLAIHFISCSTDTCA